MSERVLPLRAMSAQPPSTLAIDIGGTGIKGAVLDAKGQMVTKRLKFTTPYPLPPEGIDSMVHLLTQFSAKFPETSRMAVGFPGVVRDGKILVAPHFESSMGLGQKADPTLQKAWGGFPLEAALEHSIGRPVRVVNDAEMQGLAVIARRGIEVVITLGTGFGFALYRDGVATPHLEMGSMPLLRSGTLDGELGNRARKRIGDDQWTLHVHRAVELLDELVNFDHLYIGGGNARTVRRDGFGKRLDRITVVGNIAGILGGHYLFADELA